MVSKTQGTDEPGQSPGGGRGGEFRDKEDSGSLELRLQEGSGPCGPRYMAWILTCQSFVKCIAGPLQTRNDTYVGSSSDASTIERWTLVSREIRKVSLHP